MKKVVRQIVGIDVAQDELVVCLGSLEEDFSQLCHGRKAFANTAKGFASLVDWVSGQTQSGIPVRYVMEATGVYHEPLAYYLEGKGCHVSIILPNKISNFFRTLETKTINDQTAAEAIALFGLSRNLNEWHRPKAIFKKLRQLTRERSQIIDERTVAKNQMHAEKAEAEPSISSLERFQERVDLLNRQVKEIMAELVMTLDLDLEVKKLVKLICTIPGVGLLTAVSVLAETNGFELIRN
jgi:transposase